MIIIVFLYQRNNRARYRRVTECTKKKTFQWIWFTLRTCIVLVVVVSGERWCCCCDFSVLLAIEMSATFISTTKGGKKLVSILSSCASMSTYFELEFLSFSLFAAFQFLKTLMVFCVFVPHLLLCR